MDPPDGGEFVEGWLVAQLLGEGAYGEVRLLVHARSGACVALKAVRSGGGAEALAAAAREAALQRALRHPHVLRCLGARRHADAHYAFLEYAAGGELFERIPPDAGMPPPTARRYFAMLLSGLRYLHERGVAHRDIKPENLLLDLRDNLKISDFGMATLFRHGDRERLLSRVCGTVPYAAPEVLAAARTPYRAPPADLWAAGVVLVAMLAGELPWERAAEDDARFAAWASTAEDATAAAAGPWRRVRGAARALLRRTLQPAAERRATLPQLQQHRWLEPGGGSVARSQPAAACGAGGAGGAGDGAPAELSPACMDALISYSQPTRADDLVLAGGAGGARVRLTRVALATGAGGVAGALVAARAALAGAGLAATAQGGSLLVECGDDVAMRATPVPGALGADRTLLEFRRARGCGLHFQRRFRDVQRALAPLAPASDSAPVSNPVPMDLC